LWHVSNNKTATHSDNSYPGNNGARADYLGTITLSNDGSVRFVAQQPPAPVINSAMSVNATVGESFNYAISSSNLPTSFASSTLPAGLTLNTSTGVISGKPISAGTFVVTLTATNAGGSDNKTLSISIAPRVLEDSAYTENDVLLFLQNLAPAGTVGTDKVAYFSLGSAVNVFRDAAAGSVTELGNIYNTLNSTFGSDWTSGSSSIFVGAAGQNGFTDALSTEVTNGDYARTVYVTKSRSSIGTPGQANSASPLFDPASTGTSGAIAAANVISGMTQPGAALKTVTTLDSQNPFSNGIPATAYSAIQGGIQSRLNNSTFTYGSVTNVITALDLYRVTKTTGTDATNANTSLWHVSNNKTATHSDNSYPGNNGARADYLGTITLSNNGSVRFVAGGVVAPPPVIINSVTTASGTVGSPFSYTIAGTNTPTSFSATPLPAGLSVNATTGVISGTPSAAGSTTVTLTATNAGGSDTKTLTITIASAAQAPVINSPTTASGTVGSAFSYTIAGTNTPTNFSATPLPAGLSVNATTGVISGTPTAAGSTTVTLTATNAGGNDTKTLTITIASAAQAPSVTSARIALAQIGVPFSYTITGNNTPTSFNTSTLPTGLTVNSTTGLISGTPSGNLTTANSTTVTLTATNTGGNGSATLELYIAPASTTPPSLIFRNGVSLPFGGEISSYANGRVLTTNSGNNSHGVEVYALSSNATLERLRTIDLSSVFNGAANINSVTSVVADARGFGVATITPVGTTQNDVGRIAIFSTENGTILKTLNVGYHPDCVVMTPDRTKILVANEGEYGSSNKTISESFARPGSISVIDISSVQTLANIANLDQSNVATYDFQDFNLGTGVTLRGVRDNTLAMNTANTTANFANIEAEYITATNTQAYVTLQENNAIATFDFATRKFTRIANLGSITQTIDASDRDGSSNGKRISINDTVAGLPMPDTMVSFTKNGAVFLVTANEGDARPDDWDIDTGSALITANLTSNNTTIAINAGLTRLKLLKNAGDTNGDSLIDQPTMMGTRSFTIWNAATGNRTYDSGNMIETYVANNNPFTFNMNDGSLSKWDERSDDKGPEPEALAYGSVAGRDYVFVGNERENGIIAFDITNTANVTVAGYFNTISNNQTKDSGRYISPESITFVPADQNPTRKNLLIVGYEGTGTNGSLAVFEFRPPLSGNLTITSNGTATGRNAQPFNYAVTANMPVISYSMNGTLPTGLTFDSTTGVISGTANVSVSGNTTANVTLSVTASVSGQNGTLSNATATKPLLITIAGTPFPVITSPSSASGTQGSQFSFTVAASNVPSNVLNTYSLTGALPTGLTFNGTSGVFAGTPSVVGNFTIGLTARNSAGNSTVQPLVIQIAGAAAPVINSFGTNGSVVFEAFNTQNTPTLTVNATNAVKYQWRFNGTPIAGAISGNYNIGPAAANKVGNYSVSVTNAGNQTVTSDSIAFALKSAATLGVSAGNQSLTQGYNAIYASGSNATFSANVTNTFGNATYQWFRNGVAITANGTSANYTIPAISANTTGSYRVQVTTRNGTTTIGTVVSPEWIVSLNGAPEITNPGNLTAFVGTPFTFTANATANATVSINGTLPAGLTYNGTLRRIAGTPTAVGTFPIRLTPFGNATTGPGVPAAFNLVVSNPPTPDISSLTVNGNATSRTAQSLNTQAGPVFQVAVNNTGNHPLRYQWRLNGLPIVGANATTYNVGTTTANKTGIYDVLVTNAVGVATASQQVNFSLAPVATFSIVGGGNQFLTPGNSTTFTVGGLTQAIPTATASYQWFKDGVAIAGAKGVSYTANSTGIYSVQVTSTLGSTVLGNVTSTSWSVATQDNSAGILVYNITGNATRTSGSTETTGNFTGYMVVDRVNNNAAFIQTYTIGFAKRNSLEERPDIAAASTGPVVGSRTVFAGSMNAGDDADLDHDLVWITGRDAENIVAPATTTPSIQPAIKVFAPTTMSGVAGMLIRDGASGPEIDSFNVTLTLNNTLTANAYRNNQNLAAAIESTRAAANAAGFINE
jgi:PKD repeat protein